MDTSDAVNDLAKDAKGMSKQQLAAAIQDLINTTAEQTAGNIYRGTDAAEQSDASDPYYPDGKLEAALNSIDLLKEEIKNWECYAKSKGWHYEPLNAQSDVGPQNMRVKKLEQEIAELTPEQRAVFDAKLEARSDAAKNALAQSDVEPVAWRYRYFADIAEGIIDEWSFTFDKEHADEREIEAGCLVEPLYTAPPRPDVSGLIEAAEWHKAKALAHSARNFSDQRIVSWHRDCALALRARAADRSA